MIDPQSGGFHPGDGWVLDPRTGSWTYPDPTGRRQAQWQHRAVQAFVVLGFTGGAALFVLGMTQLADDGRIGLAVIGAAVALIAMTMVKLGDSHSWGGMLVLCWMTEVIGFAVAVAAAGWARLDGGDVPTGVAGIAAGAAIAAQVAALRRPVAAGLLGIAAGAVVIGAAITLLAGGDIPIGVAGLLAGAVAVRLGLGFVGGPAQIMHQLRRLAGTPTKRRG